MNPKVTKTNIEELLKLQAILDFVYDNRSEIFGFNTLHDADNFINIYKLEELQIRFVPLPFKQYSVSDSYLIENLELVINVFDDLLRLGEIKYLNLESSSNLVSLRHSVQQILNDTGDDLATHKYSRSMREFRESTLPYAVFSEASVKTMANSQILELTKVLFLLDKEFGAIKSKTIFLQREVDFAPKDYRLEETLLGGKSFLTLKVKYLTTVKYLIRLQAVEFLEELKTNPLNKIELDTLFHKGGGIKVVTNGNSIADLYTILIEEVELDARTFIAELFGKIKGEIDYAGIKYDLFKGELYFNGEKVDLNPNSDLGEFIKALILARGHIVDYETLAELMGISPSQYFENADPHEKYGKKMRDARHNVISKFKNKSTAEKLSKMIASESKAGYQIKHFQ